MKKYIYIAAAITVIALSAGVSARQTAIPSAGAKPDSASAVQQPPPQRQLNKQASVNRPTKKTNWSKIKTLFE